MNEMPANSLANNSGLRNKKVANPFSDVRNGKIRELEITITSKCNLTCFGCGFNVPNQISAVDGGKGIEQHIDALIKMKDIGISIDKIVIVGGEAALVSGLEAIIDQINAVGVCSQIELVTNGLYPRGVTKGVLKRLDSFVISDYICTDKFSVLWKDYLNCKGYKGKVDFRRKDAWDDLFRDVENSPADTKKHWDSCFYRTYDVTLERGRLFTCSRIAKKGWDKQGLPLDATTSKKDVIDYLVSESPKEACYSCATVGQCSQIPVAKQMSTDLNKIVDKAERYLEKEVESAKQ